MNNFSLSQRTCKSQVSSEFGLVASQHRKASELGVEILRKGGNAIDAGVAVSFALGVLEPWMSGLGGGGYLVHHCARTGDVKVVDFGMRSPQNLDPADYPLDGGQASDLFPWAKVVDDKNGIGATAIAVPGMLAGLDLAHETFGQLPWHDLVTPSIELARSGFDVDWYAQLMISSVCADLNKFDASRKAFLNEDGSPKCGTWTRRSDARCTFPELAETLTQIAEEGAGCFYGGELGQKIVADIQQQGGCLSLEDLKSYQARLLDPLEISYGDSLVYATPELTAGPTLGEALALFPQADSNSEVTPEDFGLMAKALQKAYEERMKTMGDVRSGDSGCTTNFCIVDRQGNMVALTQTLLSLFGSKVTLPQSGILMNNGIMWFDPEPGKPNSLGPDLRCLSNMCPVLVKLPEGLLALGAAGGRKILPAVAQLIAFISGYKMNLEQAFHTPRFDVSGLDEIIVDEAMADNIKSHLSKLIKTSALPCIPFPYSFGIPSAVFKGRDQNTAMTEVMSPWADAACE